MQGTGGCTVPAQGAPYEYSPPNAIALFLLVCEGSSIVFSCSSQFLAIPDGFYVNCSQNRIWWVLYCFHICDPCGLYIQHWRWYPTLPWAEVVLQEKPLTGGTNSSFSISATHPPGFGVGQRQSFGKTPTVARHILTRLDAVVHEALTAEDVSSVSSRVEARLKPGLLGCGRMRARDNYDHRLRRAH